MLHYFKLEGKPKADPVFEKARIRFSNGLDPVFLISRILFFR